MSIYKRFLLLGLCLIVPVLALSAAGSGSMSTGSGNNADAANTTESNMSPEEWYNQGVALSDAGHHTEAIPKFIKAIALKKDFAEAYNMLGFSYRNTGKLALAFQNYEKALKIRPDYVEAHEYVGETYLLDNDLTHAMQHYIFIKDRNPKIAAELWEKIEGYVAKKVGSL